MAGLVPFARIVDLESDSILATTTDIIDYALEWGLDKAGRLSIEVGAGTPGDGTTTSFASALLRAASDLGSSPRPLLLEFSLDGGHSFDSRKMVEQPERSLKASARTIKEDGADLGSILATVPVERVTFTDIALADCLNGNPGHSATGTFGPLGATAGGLSGSGAIPNLYGLLTATPGLETWPDGARARLRFTGVVNGDVAQTATNVDVDSATTLAACEAIVNRLAGAAPAQHYGHYVADPSDAPLNLSGDLGTATDRAFVVGSVGGAPHLTFDATDSADVDETRTARLHLDGATLKTDDSALYSACNFVGGSSTAGFPDGAKITALTVLNGTQQTGQSASKTDWRDDVPVIGINVNDAAGGLYFTILDGTIRPVPGSPATPCQSLAVDDGDAGASRPPALLMGTPHGIYIAEYARSISPAPSGVNAWTLLGDLNANVTRINVKVDDVNDPQHRVVFAHVKGTAGSERTDGIWRWTHNAGDPDPLAGTWETVLQNTKTVDMIATDYKTVWVVLSQPQDTLYRYGITGGVGIQQATYPLPHGGQIDRVQEVVTAHPPADSVWVLTEGAPSPAYYLLNDGGNWGAWFDANGDGTLAGPGRTPLQINRAVGLGVAFEGATASVLVGTDQGVYGSTQPLGTPLDWISLNQQGGLANYNITNVAAGEAQTVLGANVNRIFCTTADDLLYSNSAGRWWQTIRGRNRTDAGPHLAAISVAVTADLPANDVRTWGPPGSGADVTIPATIPSGPLAGRHNPDVPPDGYRWERYLDQHLDFQYRLVNTACPFPGLSMEQLPALQTNASVDADTASASVMLVAKRWLQQASVPQTHLVCESSFSTQEAALRTLRPTQRVSVNGSVTIVDISSAGDAVTTRVWEAINQPMYVLAQSIKKGPGMTAVSTTTLGMELLATPVSASDMGNAMMDAVSSLKVWR